MTQEKKPKWGRRIYLINPKFQFTMVGWVAALAGLVISLLYALDLYFFHRFHELGLSVGLPPEHIYYRFLGEQSQFMMGAVLLVSALIFIILMIGGIMLSHRIAGPLYRLQKHMVDISEGQTIKDVKFRKNDYFPELAEAFNKLNKSYQHSRKEHKTKASS